MTPKRQLGLIQRLQKRLPKRWQPKPKKRPARILRIR